MIGARRIRLALVALVFGAALASSSVKAQDDATRTLTIFAQNSPPVAVADVTVGDTGDARCDWYNSLAT